MIGNADDHAEGEAVAAHLDELFQHHRDDAPGLWQSHGLRPGRGTAP